MKYNTLINAIKTTFNPLRSDSYLGTFHRNSSGDMEKLAEIKKIVSSYNRIHKGMRPYRVEVKGRKPYTKINGKSYDWGGNIVGGIANASVFDAYLYYR